MTLRYHQTGRLASNYPHSTFAATRPYSVRSAYNYIAVWSHFGKEYASSATVALIELSAMYALTTNESAKKAALRLAKKGEKITQKMAKDLIARFSDHVDVETATNSPQVATSLRLQVYHADLMAARAGEVSISLADYHPRRQDRANRRFLSAVKWLATVRRLALPLRVDLNVSASVETKPAEPTHPLIPNWERGSLAN